MLNTDEFGDLLKDRGFDFYAGVPCSFLKDFINYAVNECTYIMAANEGDAVAACSGAYLGGKKSVFLCQNSGLSNATSPLTSLNYPFKLPILGFVSLRGDPALKDEPQHQLMGKITDIFLEKMEIKYAYLSTNITEAEKQITHANACIEKNQSFFFIVKKDTFQPVRLKEKASFSTRPQKDCIVKIRADTLPTRFEALKALTQLRTQDSIILATTGYTGRELFEVEDGPHNFYMVGSMGCVSAIGLGLALTQPDKKIIAIDGDGALLMRLGNMATNACYQPNNLFHLLLDNGTHESTGGQVTASSHVDFVQMAAGAGYPRSYYLHDLNDLKCVYQEWVLNPVLTFAYIKTAPGTSKNLSRPHLTPEAIKERLMNFIHHTESLNHSL